MKNCSPSEPLKLLVGRPTVEMWTLRLMSACVADKLAQGINPAIEATIVKDLGNSFEQMLCRASSLEAIRPRPDRRCS